MVQILYCTVASCELVLQQLRKNQILSIELHKSLTDAETYLIFYKRQLHDLEDKSSQDKLLLALSAMQNSILSFHQVLFNHELSIVQDVLAIVAGIVSRIAQVNKDDSGNSLLHCSSLINRVQLRLRGQPVLSASDAQHPRLEEPRLVFLHTSMFIEFKNRD